MAVVNTYCMYLDINDFKPVNDTYGHSVGDLVIEHFGDILTNTFLKNSVTEIDEDFVLIGHEAATVFRQGGDEFVVVVDCEDTQLDPLLERLHDNLSIPYQVDNIKFDGLSASVGIINKDSYLSIKLLNTVEKSPIGVADLVMYFAKGLARRHFSEKHHEELRVKLGVIAVRQLDDAEAISNYAHLRVIPEIDKTQRELQMAQILDNFYEQKKELFKYFGK